MTTGISEVISFPGLEVKPVNEFHLPSQLPLAQTIIRQASQKANSVKKKIIVVITLIETDEDVERIENRTG